MSLLVFIGVVRDRNPIDILISAPRRPAGVLRNAVLPLSSRAPRSRSMRSTASCTWGDLGRDQDVDRIADREHADEHQQRHDEEHHDVCIKPPIRKTVTARRLP